MIPAFGPLAMDVLNHFYNRFKNRVIDSQIRIEQNSLLLTVIKLPVNQLSRLLIDSALSNITFSKEELVSLDYKGCIRSLDELGKPHDYVITAAGIWFVEFDKNQLDINRLVSYLQETKLSFKVSSKPLKNIEKTILFAMIAIRNFSFVSPMDINNESFRDDWIEIFDLCTKYLYKNEFVSKEKWNTFHPGNEHAITHVMRRANDLPQKTIHVYQPIGNNRYALDVDNADASPEKQLFFLFKLIFGKIATNEQVENIYSFCCDMAYDKSKQVRESFEYINPEWDTILKDALRRLYYER
jgi:hypothetical protein